MLNKVMIAAMAAMCAFGSVAQANINWGQSVARGSYGVGAVDDVTTYTTFVTSMTTNFINPTNSPTLFSGTVTSEVYQDASGNLAFQYQVWITAPDSPMRSLTIGGQWGLVDVYEVGSDYLGSSTASGGTGWSDGSPTSIGLSDFGTPEVVFKASGADGTLIGVGAYTAKFWYTTNATSYGTALLGALDSGVIGNAPVLVPIPAPGAVVLAFIGLGLVGWVKRRMA